MKFVPRNDYVLIKIERIRLSRQGLAIPEQAPESRAWIVQACGPEVKNPIAAGTRVIVGPAGEAVLCSIPEEPDLILIKDKNVVVVYMAEEEKTNGL
jgi:hypothetical protein